LADTAVDTTRTVARSARVIELLAKLLEILFIVRLLQNVLTADNGVSLLLFRSDDMNRGGIEIGSTSLGSRSMDCRLQKGGSTGRLVFTRKVPWNSLQVVVPSVVLFLRNKLF
jgi:hypothetical protein